MKRLILLAMVALALNGCATTMTQPGTSAPITAAQDAAEKSLFAAGQALQATPTIMDALYNAGKISKADYNNVVPVYNQATASFKLAVSALKSAQTAGQDPARVQAYVTALQEFMSQKATIDNLLAAFGEKPAATPN